MGNIPEDGTRVKDNTEIKDEANPDKRLPQQLKDKIIEAENEFEDRTKSGNRDANDASGKSVKEINKKATSEDKQETEIAKSKEQTSSGSKQDNTLPAKGLQAETMSSSSNGK